MSASAVAEMSGGHVEADGENPFDRQWPSEPCFPEIDGLEVALAPLADVEAIRALVGRKVSEASGIFVAARGAADSPILPFGVAEGAKQAAFPNLALQGGKVRGATTDGAQPMIPANLFEERGSGGCVRLQERMKGLVEDEGEEFAVRIPVGRLIREAAGGQGLHGILIPGRPGEA